MSARILSNPALAECQDIYSAFNGSQPESLNAAFEHAAVLGARAALNTLAYSSEVHFTQRTPILLHMETEYPLPQPPVQWRTSKRDSNGYEWQIRDGELWWCLPKTGETKFAKHHTTLRKTIDAMVHDKCYTDAAMLCELASNPRLP